MNKLIAIVGQTSSGKSDLAIELAKLFDGEIVSADSRQVYKNLDWCSGKVSKQEQQIVPHHLLDVVDLGKQFTLFDFQSCAYECIDDIIKRGKVPFLVGGTGLYSRAVIEGYNLEENKPDKNARENLEKLSKKELTELCLKNNIELPSEITPRRMIRLLEKSETEQKPNSPKYHVLQIGINWSKEELYERIRRRLELRMPHMIEEIKSLIKSGVKKDFLNSLGLEAKFIVKYLDGEFSSYDEFFEKLFTEERHFAKRQATWYKKEKNIVWVDADKNMLDFSIKLVKDFLSKID